MKTYLYKNIVSDSAICGGRPTFDGTRLTVQTILSYLLAGDSAKDIMEAFPNVTKEDIETVKEFATFQMEQSFFVKEIH